MALTSGLGFGVLFGIVVGLGLEMGLPAGAIAGLCVGVLFGLVFGTIMVERFQIIRAEFGLDEPEGFEETIEAGLAGVGYTLAETRGDLRIFKPGYRAGLMAGRVALRIQGGSVTMVGPRAFVARFVPPHVLDEIDG